MIVVDIRASPKNSLALPNLKNAAITYSDTNINLIQIDTGTLFNYKQ